MDRRRMLVSLGVVILTIVVWRTLLPEKSQLGSRDFPATQYAVVIVPMAGVPSSFVSTLEKELETDHQFEVRVTTHMGKGAEMKIKDTGQYHSGYLAKQGLEIAQRTGNQDSFVIVLTNEDINTPDSGLRYNYSTHYEGVSVVSLARINPSNLLLLPNLYQIPTMYIKMTERALKIVNKAIGYGVYGYEASSDWNSVMYSPIMGPDDLDRVGEWY